MKSPILIALLICIVSAGLEGIFAGAGVKKYFAELKQPRHSLPLWAWYVVGLLYYGMCFTVLYRLFRENSSMLQKTAVALILLLMGVNAIWNFVFFRAKNLRASFLWFLPYNVLAVALLIVLLRIDRVAAYAVVPYLAYLLYGNGWIYGLWRLNARG